MPSLATFPNELTIRVFSELDFQGILNCSQTCRLFYNIIKNSIYLQYQVKLAVAGIEDGGAASSLTVAERLAQLSAVEHGWTNLQFRKRSSLQLQRNNLWELFGGVLAHGVASPTTRGLRFTELPSAIRGTSERVWQHRDMGVDIRDFGIDPSQDLAVLISQPVDIISHATGAREYLIHLRAMSTGENHPKALVPILSCVPSLDILHWGFIIQVMGDFLAVLFHTLTEPSPDQLFIWDWKTGRVVTYLAALSPGRFKIGSFSFLSPRHFILARFRPEGDLPPVLEVYDFLDKDREGFAPRITNYFGLPRVDGNAFVAVIQTRSDPSPEGPSQRSTFHGRPFYTAPTSRLLVVSMDFLHMDGHRQESYVLFVHHSALLEKYVKHPSERVIPWERWGPKKTRLISTMDNEHVWVCYVHGTRYVRMEPPRTHNMFGTRLAHIRMLDFNQLALERGRFQCIAKRRSELRIDFFILLGKPDRADLMYMDTAPSTSDEEQKGSCRTIVPVTTPTVIRREESLFEHDIVTTLPYRDIRSKETFRYQTVMIDEDGLVGLVFDSLDSDVKRVDFLSI